MRKLISSAAVITAAGALIVGGGAYSTFIDSASTPGSFTTGTVKMAVAAGVPGVDIFALDGACTQHYTDQVNNSETLNLGTVNNLACTSTFAVHNSGSLPFELSASTLIDSNPAGLVCFTTTINHDGFNKRNIIPPGADQHLTVNTITVSDDKLCQTQTDTVTAHLIANEARPVKLVVNGDFSLGLTGWTAVDHGNGRGQAVPFDGPTGTLENGLQVEALPNQPYAAGTTQGGPGDHVLYQDFTVPVAGNHILSLDYSYKNYAGKFIQLANLDSSMAANQQARIDVMTTGSPVGSVSPGDILSTLLVTPPGSATTVNATHVSADLTAFAGQTVRLRLAEVDNQSYFSMLVGNVQFS